MGSCITRRREREEDEMERTFEKELFASSLLLEGAKKGIIVSLSRSAKSFLSRQRSWRECTVSFSNLQRVSWGGSSWFFEWELFLLHLLVSCRREGEIVFFSFTHCLFSWQQHFSFSGIWWWCSNRRGCCFCLYFGLYTSNVLLESIFVAFTLQKDMALSCIASLHHFLSLSQPETETVICMECALQSLKLFAGGREERERERMRKRPVTGRRMIERHDSWLTSKRGGVGCLNGCHYKDVGESFKFSWILISNERRRG